MVIETRQYTQELCQRIDKKYINQQYEDFTSPAKWHFAHTTWFFENFILVPYLKDYKIFNTKFNYLFNSYYNHVGEQFPRACRGNITHPTLDQVYIYREYVDNHLKIILNNKPNQVIQELLILGSHHEQQHQELLLTDLKYTMAQDVNYSVYNDELYFMEVENKEKGMVLIQDGLYDIGYSGSEFCYDNEQAATQVYLPEFSISKELITNKEYINFIDDGGYRNFDLWLSEGWEWVKKNNITAPLYWKKKDKHWYYYTLGGFKSVTPNGILGHISFYEAYAFANWKKMRLPTEFEWEVAAKYFNWGDRWEWTYSSYLPYPNFNKIQGALGEYNGKFMINQMVLRGASVATPPGHSRETYRNFFYPQDRWQFTGIRLAR